MRNLICISVIFAVLDSVASATYGPSISSLTGVFVNWRGQDFFEGVKKVYLKHYPGYSVTLPLITDSVYATSSQIFKERGISTSGEFIVEAPSSYGIIAVIQDLKLRKVKGKTKSNVTCSDYLQIGNLLSDTNGVFQKTDQICGFVSREDFSRTPNNLIGQRVFLSKRGIVRVSFNHAYVAELVDSLLGSKQKHVLRAEVTFTGFRANCISTRGNQSLVNSSVTEQFHICNDYSNTTDQVCISSGLKCDDTFNCGGDGDQIGSDENYFTCPDKPIRTTEFPPFEDSSEPEESEDGLSDLATYLGIPALSNYPSRKYERKFRPAYVSSHQSGSGILFDYTSRRPQVTRQASDLSNNAPNSDSRTRYSGDVESVSNENSSSANIISENNQGVGNIEDDVYSRREISQAINSVIYGVAVFIIFTIFITVFIVCVTKKIQTTWTARVERRQSEDMEGNRRRISTHSIISAATRRGSECDPGSVSTTVVDDSLPPDLATEDFDLPPSYDTLFPTGHKVDDVDPNMDVRIK